MQVVKQSTRISGTSGLKKKEKEKKFKKCKMEGMVTQVIWITISMQMQKIKNKKIKKLQKSAYIP